MPSLTTFIQDRSGSPCQTNKPRKVKSLRPEIKKYELNLLTYRNILVRKLKGCSESKLHSLFLGAVHDRVSESNIKQTFPIKIRASQADSAEETVTHQLPCTV